MSMTIDDYLEKQAELQKALEDSSERLTKDFFENFFSKFPTLTAVRWTQYAPYFNDGEPCVFGLNDPEFSDKVGVTSGGYTYGCPEDEDDDDSEWYVPMGAWEAGRKGVSIPEKDTKLSEWSKCFWKMEPVLEQLTEDGLVTVLKTNEGITITVDDYDHD